MSKVVYHLGTGTYFDLDDDVVVIDTDHVTGLDDEILAIYGDEIAVGFGKRIAHIVTKEDN